MAIFQLAVGVKESLVESQRMSSVEFISFHRLHVGFIASHIPFIRRVSFQTLAILSYFVIVFVMVWLSFWKPVQVAIPRFMNM